MNPTLRPRAGYAEDPCCPCISRALIGYFRALVLLGDTVSLPTLEAIEAAADLVYRRLSATPQICWPLLAERLDCELWLKHENHCETGSFKVRGGLVYLDECRDLCANGVVAATRGNYGQSVGFAARASGTPALIVVPKGNSPDKNRAMRALGVELVVAGSDFDESAQAARELAEARGMHLMPSFAAPLVRGVGTYAVELFRHLPDLQRVYVPIGLGSGICGVAAARNALAPDVEIVGVVAEGANAYLQSFEAGGVRTTNEARTIADGLAVRIPNEAALSHVLDNVHHIVAVSDDDVLRAMGWIYSDTHNVAEGAGAAAVAAVALEREDNAGRQVAAVVTGGNVAAPLYARALATLAERPA